MGRCKYCGQKAGFLSNKHKDCEIKYNDGKSEIIKMIEDTIISSNDYNKIKTDIVRTSNDSFIKEEELDSIYTSAFDNTVEHFLEDGILSEEEENKLTQFTNSLGLSQENLDRNGSFQKVVKSSILRELTEGNIPDPRLEVQGHIPFNFQKSEKMIWMFNGVEFYEQTTRTQYQGGYSGVSIRVAKGVYYRTGGFKGNPVKVSEMKYIGTGLFALTNKHVYFSSPTKNFRVQLSKIITMDPYEDGIGLQKEGVTAKPQVFKNLDGWFVYNGISNLT